MPNVMLSLSDLMGLNAPFGAWCFLTIRSFDKHEFFRES